MENNRDFKGIWIPKEIWLDERLNALDKIILLEIDSLDNEETHCFASNDYLAEFCQCSVRKVSESISTLIKLNYLQVVSFDGRTRILQSKLEKNAKQTSKICKADTQKMPHNNINNNIDDNINIIREKRFIPPSIEEVEEYIKTKNYNVDPESFVNFYTSKGWYVGKNKMKDWKSAVNTWQRKTLTGTPRRQAVVPSFYDDYKKGIIKSKPMTEEETKEMTDLVGGLFN